jgi:signal transduction histidine kinase
LANFGEHAEADYAAGQTLRGGELFRLGLTIGQVVYHYGNVCQAVTEIAFEQSVSIPPDEFRKLNISLDIAIAEAVTEYARIREEMIRGANVEKLGFLAHELRNLLSTATLAFDAVREGQVGIKGKTSHIVDRSLDGMRLLVDRALSEVRLGGAPLNSERIPLSTLFEEVQIAATMHSKRRDTPVAFGPVDPNVAAQGDSQILAAIVLNLIQNACKFTKAHTHVQVDTRTTDDRIYIDVTDQCGGLPPGKAQELFHAFEQRGADRSGLGLGLAICLRGAHAMGGDVSVVDRPGEGCVFTVSVPHSTDDVRT